MAYAIGHIGMSPQSGGIGGVMCRGPFKGSELGPYVVAQVLGAVAGAFVLSIIASGQAGFSTADGFAANGFGAHSPGGSP